MSQDVNVTLDHASRIAVLESQVGELKAEHSKLEGKLDTAIEKLDAIIQENVRYRGTIGGILLTFAGLMTVLTFAKEWGAKLIKLL